MEKNCSDAGVGRYGRRNELDEVAESVLRSDGESRSFPGKDAHQPPQVSIDHDRTATAGAELRRPREISDCSL